MNYFFYFTFFCISYFPRKISKYISKGLMAASSLGPSVFTHQTSIPIEISLKNSSISTDNFIKHVWWTFWLHTELSPVINTGINYDVTCAICNSLLVQWLLLHALVAFFLERVQKRRILDDLKILDWVKMQISETCKQKSQIITVYWIRF